MDQRKKRKKIIDSTAVTAARRSDRRYSYCASKTDGLDTFVCKVGLGGDGITNHFGFHLQYGSCKARRKSHQLFYVGNRLGKEAFDRRNEIDPEFLKPLNKIRSKGLEDLANDDYYRDDSLGRDLKTHTSKDVLGAGVYHVKFNPDREFCNQKNSLSEDIYPKRNNIGPYKTSVTISSVSSSMFDSRPNTRNMTYNMFNDICENVNGHGDRDQGDINNELKTNLVPSCATNERQGKIENRITAFGAKLFDFLHDTDDEDDDNEDEEDKENEAYSNMTETKDGSPRLLSVEEKWQIIFNEKTRAPIYAVSQYIEYLNQFVDGKTVTPAHKNDVTKKDGISHVTYLLRKLKLDLKMSYESFLEEFLKEENKGLELLVKLLKSLQNTGSQQSGSTNMSQLKNYKKTLTDEHDCLLCIKFTLRMKKICILAYKYIRLPDTKKSSPADKIAERVDWFDVLNDLTDWFECYIWNGEGATLNRNDGMRSALLKLLEIPYGLETVTMGLLSTFTKSRGTAIEILTVTLSESEGFSRTLECFTFLKLKIGEPVRFKSLMNMMNVDSQQSVIFKVACMKFLNTLLDCSPNYNYRVFLQHETETAGLDIQQMDERVSGMTGLEFDDLRYELDLWKRKYINVDDVLTNNVSPTEHQQHLIDELKLQIQVLSKEKSFLERQLTSVGAELKSKYEEIQRRNAHTRDIAMQCKINECETNNVGCQCSDFDDFGNPLKTAALYFGWQESAQKDVMTYYDYRINIEGQGHDEESETDHVIKVEDWLRTHCDSPEREVISNSSVGYDYQSKQYFRRQYSIRHKPKKTKFYGNWKLAPRPINYYPSRFENQQCHTTNCDRCRFENGEKSLKLNQDAMIPNISQRTDPGSNKVHIKLQLESQSSDSAIGGSGERLWSAKQQKGSREKSEEERLQDLVTPDDSASACPEVEPFPDYSSIATRLDKSYDAELSEVLREFEGHLSRYDTQQEV